MLFLGYSSAETEWRLDPNFGQFFCWREPSYNADVHHLTLPQSECTNHMCIVQRYQIRMYKPYVYRLTLPSQNVQS